jgi:hypothetical protein
MSTDRKCVKGVWRKPDRRDIVKYTSTESVDTVVTVFDQLTKGGRLPASALRAVKDTAAFTSMLPVLCSIGSSSTSNNSSSSIVVLVVVVAVVVVLVVVVVVVVVVIILKYYCYY